MEERGKAKEEKREKEVKDEGVRERRPPVWSAQRCQEKSYSSAEEYFKELEDWMNEAYFWYGVTAAFPYYLAISSTPSLAPPPPPPASQAQSQSQGTSAAQSTAPAHDRQQNRSNDSWDGIECRIPSLWKRVAAEAIDFSILFFLKLAMTFIAVDFFYIVDLDKFDFVTFQKDTKLEYKVLLQMTHDIIILELVHRIVVCIFEAFWLQGGTNGTLGGATPGKRMMRLRVIRCHSSLSLPQQQPNTPQGASVVIVRPGTDLGLGASLARALVKNIVMTFLIPAGFAFLYFRHNRTGYDMICNTIVVEEPLVVRPRQNQT